MDVDVEENKIPTNSKRSSKSNIPDINNLLLKIHQQNANEKGTTATETKQENPTGEETISDNSNKNSDKLIIKKDTKQKIPRGMPKSGRPWKSQKEKFSKIKKTIHRRTPVKKEEFRKELQHIKELSRSIKEERKQQNEQKKLRREENAKRKLENERKSEVVQVISNPRKLKRMKKKALRQIQKRDLSNIKAI